MHTNALNPTLQTHYVRLMMDTIARGLVSSSHIDLEIRQELKGFPKGFIFAMQVYPNQAQFYLQIDEHYQLKRINNPNQKPDLMILFKHIQHAFSVFTFQESTARAFANDRMIADGDLSYAIRFVRCLNRMEALILPKMIAQLAIKNYPQDLSLSDKLKLSSQIYFHIAKSYFNRSKT